MDPTAAGSVGLEYSPVRLQNRILVSASERRSSQSDANSDGPRTETSPGKGNFGSSKQASYSCSSQKSNQAFIPIVFLPNPQERKSMASDSQLKTSQQTFYQTQTVQDGDSCVDHSGSLSRLMGYLDRSQGRLSSCANPPSLSTIPGFQVQRGRLPVQRHAFRSLHGSQGFYPDHEGYFGVSKVQGKDSFRLPGRLAPSGQLGGGIPPVNGRGGVSLDRSGLGHQFSEVLLSPGSEGSLSRCRLRPSRGYRFSIGSKDRHRSKLGVRSCSTGTSQGPFLASFPGPSGQFSGSSSLVQAQDAAVPTSSPQSLQALPGFAFQEDSLQSRSRSRSSLVVSSSQPQDRQTVQIFETPVLHVHGRLPDRLGGCFRGSIHNGNLDRNREQPSHQYTRTQGGGQGDSSLEGLPVGSFSNSFHRQFHNDGVYQPSRRNQVSPTVSGDAGSLLHLSVDQSGRESLSLSGSDQHDGGCSLQGKTKSQRVGVISSVGESHLRPVRPSVSRPFCFGRELQVDPVLYSVSSPRGVGDGCDVAQLGQSHGVRLPSMVHASKGPSEAARLIRNTSPGGSLLAQTRLVPGPSRSSHRSSVQVSSSVETPDTAERSDPPSRDQGGSSLCLVSFRKRLQEAGISGQALEIATNSRRASTVRTYDSRLEKFFSWAADHDVNPLEASLDQVTTFLVSLFKEGLQTSTVRNYRSAVAAVHRGFDDGTSISTNPAITHLLKGMFAQRPPRQRLAPSWSINDVLAKLAGHPYEPIQDAPLEALLHKTLFLVAAASARRRSELHALSVRSGFIRFTPAGVSLIPNPQFLAKNQSESFSPSPIFLPRIESTSSVAEDRLVCPVRALKWYIHKTKNLRTSDVLFILPRSPYSPASKDTISKWLVRLILPHASPMESVRAHDVRAQATSTAWFRGIPLPDIMAAASWKTPSSFVACYLTDVISQEGNFARSVLLGSRHQTSGRPSTSSRC